MKRAALLSFVVVTLAGCGGHTRTVIVTAPSTTPSSTPTSSSRQVLPPATVPPRVGECSQQLNIGADGNAGPISCSNGELNVLAWDYLAKGSPLVMSLGPDATPDQVQKALCADVRSSTNPIETSAYQIAALYYGWKFAVDPTQVLINGCR